VICTTAAQVSRDNGFYTTASKQQTHILSAPPPLEGRCTYMELRDWYELVRIQLKREEGQTMAEYGLLIAFIAIIALVGVKLLGTSLSGFFTTLAGTI
jgi:pilus assembly protein Flp/PilA